MRKSLFLLTLVFIAVYILPLNLRPLVDPDETRYSEIPREMIASGDYVVPRLNGVLYFEKPVMGYWLAALSMKVFGETNIAGRFPQAMSVGLSALLIFFLAGRMFGNVQAGTASALIFLSCLEVFAVGVFNTLDSLLSFFLTACLASFFMAWENRQDTKKYLIYLVLSGVFCGLACHTKGFLAFAVPVSVIVPFLAWERKWLDVLKVPWVPIATALLVMLPWGLLIHFRAPDFWNYFFWHEHVARFFSGVSQHPEPLYFFIPVLAGGMFPHTVLIPSAVSGMIVNGFDSRFKRYLFCWFFFPFLFFSASSGKLETYILPCFPPLSMMMGIFLFEALGKGKNRLFNGGVKVLMVFPVLASIAVLALQHGASRKMPYLFSDTYKIVLFMMAMAGFAALLYCSVKAKAAMTKITCFAVSPLLFYTSAHVLTPDKAILRNSPTVFMEENLQRFPKDAILVSPSTPIKAVCWSLKRDDVFLLDDGGELSYGFGQNDMRHRQLSFAEFGKMVGENKGKRDVILVLDQRRYNRFKANLPQPSETINNGEDGFIMAVYR
jgi:4-amino-4-deoxy-L-arabinose transferase